MNTSFSSYGRFAIVVDGVISILAGRTLSEEDNAIRSESISVLIIVALIIGILLILLFKYVGENVRGFLIIMEIIALGLVYYIIIWVKVCWLLEFFGFTFSKWSMIIPLIIIVIIHALFLVITKIAAHIRR